MTRAALLICAAVTLLWVSSAFAADRERFCYWGGLLRDCKTGCIESENSRRCLGTILRNKGQG